MSEAKIFPGMVDRFMKYISFETMSDEAVASCPSTAGQLTFGKYLVEELKSLGLTEVSMDDRGYIMATLPANGCEDSPVVGLIAHMDTSPDMAAGPMAAKIVAAYDGKDIVLNKDQGIILSPQDFPELKQYEGQDIIVTDGLTLLGADDKAGICEIISGVEYLLQHPEIKHGKIRLGFTPDEEIGRGADYFDVTAFGADFAYTLDGDAVGGLEYENFNAANAVIHFHGRNVHPGAAKNKMINALKLAAQWQMQLPAEECPECTEGYEGFYHVNSLSGDVEAAEMVMLIRDHDRNRFEQRKAFLQALADKLNEQYGQGAVVADIKDSYYNMREKIEPVMNVLHLAEQAMEQAGVKPIIKPIRGGTDGARLSFMGLPCPNIFTGGHNYHGRYEYLPIPSMEKATEVVVNIIVEAGKQQKSDYAV